MEKAILKYLQKTVILALVFAYSLANIAYANSPFGDPLVDAADRGDIGKIMQLVRSHHNVNSLGKFGSTALMRATYHHNQKLLKMLLNAGANPNNQDISGATALHIAARQGYTDIVNILLNHGAIVDVVDNEGFTPLMRAVSANRLEATKALLQNHADANVVNKFNQSAIKLAANRDPIIKKLFGIQEAKESKLAAEAQNPATKAILKPAAKSGAVSIVKAKEPSPAAALPTGASNNKIRVGRAIKVEGELPKLAIASSTETAPKEQTAPKAEVKIPAKSPKTGFYMYVKGFADEKAAVDFWYWVVSGAQFTGKESKLMLNKITTPPEPALRLAHYPAIKDIFKECRKVREQNRALYCYAVPVILTK